MKKFFFFPALLNAALVSLSIFLVVSCQQSERSVSPTADDARPSGARMATQTILQIAASNPDFSALAAAVVKTGLTDAVGNPAASLTVFAPTNAAFAQLSAPFNNAANISAITSPALIDALRGILLYHVLGSEVKFAQVPNGPLAVATLRTRGSRNDNTIYLFKRVGKQLFINGNSQVIAPDVDATNGVIHVIDRVLLPPSQTIAEIAIGNPAFSALVAALVKTNLAGVFTGEGDFTVFAPTNAAFAQLPAPFNNAQNISGIADPAQIAALSNILRYHVLGARVFSPAFGLPTEQSTLADGGATLLTVPGMPLGRVKGDANPTFSNVAAGNLLATNGVIHVIDQVLLP
ncbi:fasciclin domain-containing protein [Tellurirhabdus rosea]|uniref:fasciclin domain-containing protein n=1 Tax=Tellurirhabdus rosea TaxID=2674997 RepID=UPI00225C3447|nr:fasciclin domain-containing protein [Tellurirhabdus rosea]